MLSQVHCVNSRNAALAKVMSAKEQIVKLTRLCANVSLLFGSSKFFYAGKRPRTTQIKGQFFEVLVIPFTPRS